jgi:hypothetical protein
MLTAIVPAYGIARFAVSRPWAVAAAVASVAAPVMSYAPILVQEPFAYPAATASLWLIGRYVLRPSWRTAAPAAAGAVVGALVRSQLVALLLVLALCALAVAWRTPRWRRWRESWSRADWIGFAALGVGGILAASALLGQVSSEWANTSATFPGRIVEYGAWAAGAFAIGLGFFPLVAALTALVRPRAQYRDPGTLAWVTLAASSFVAFAWYAALKGAYLSTVFSSLIVERNLVYLTPIVFAGAALLLERRDPAWWAALVAGAIVLWTVLEVPKKLDYPYYESHGLAILALANRLWAWPVERIEHATVVGVLLGTALVAVLAAIRRPRVATAAAIAIAAAVGVWNLTTEIYAANGEREFSARLFANLVQPPTWIDDTVGDGTVVVLGQQLGVDPTGLWQDEFWNRSITKVWSVDGSAPGPGPTLTPDLVSPDGTLGSVPGTAYALTYNGVELQSPVVRRLGTTTLYRLDGGPLRLSFSQTDVYPDGWMGASAAYNRFGAAADGPGFARATLSREAFCGGEATTARVRVGPLVIGEDAQPALGTVTAAATTVVPPCGRRTVLLRAPRGPWRLEVAATTFPPEETGDSGGRDLAARVSFGFEPLTR